MQQIPCAPEWRNHAGKNAQGRYPLRERTDVSNMGWNQPKLSLKQRESLPVEPLVLGEQWRENADRKKDIGPTGLNKLHLFISENFLIEPRFMDSGLPVLSVRPCDLFLYILDKLGEQGSRTFDDQAPFVEVYGGTANAVVAADAGLEPNVPTDFDARFYIPHFDGRQEYDGCREIVERYLQERLYSMLDPGYHAQNQHLCTVELVRRFYFQKQVRFPHRNHAATRHPT
jgi:hypothetical protein